MNNLPKAFVDRLAAQLGDELPAFLRTYEEPYQRGIRLNPMKPVEERFLPEGLWEAVPWEPTGHYLSMDSKDQYGRDMDQWPLWRTENAEAVMEHIRSYAKYCTDRGANPFICFYMHPWEFHKIAALR